MSKDETPRNSRKILWLVAAVCIAPFIASFATYLFFPPQNRVNYGQLLEPVKMPAGQLKRVDGGDFSFARLEGK